MEEIRKEPVKTLIVAGSGGHTTGNKNKCMSASEKMSYLLMVQLVVDFVKNVDFQRRYEYDVSS